MSEIRLWWDRDDVARDDLFAGLAHLNDETNGRLNAEYDKYVRAALRFAQGYGTLSPNPVTGESLTFSLYNQHCFEKLLSPNFLSHDAFQHLYRLKPLIADEGKLRRIRDTVRRLDLTDDEMYPARNYHREFIAAVDTYTSIPTKAAAGKVGFVLGRLLYVVRSNLTHSEKTPYGPIPDKAKRDRQVLSVALPALKDVVLRSLGEPRRRLAVYGTLRRGYANHALIDDLGEPKVATIQGTVVEEGGCPMFTWAFPSGEIPVEIYTSEALTEERWADLDRFEGSAYQRIAVPARLEDGTHEVVHVYSRRLF